ncbi:MULTISPECIES: hypothetical protein [unclassified Nocardia]|uniref:hypothetical protein n=1 Tax=unclassified Nocardia TaxID=2637762 RepID=UPI00278C2367|nr:MULTISPECIES: hypothetical protein [unclassified Nocardia]
MIDTDSAFLIADTRLAGRTLISLATERNRPYKQLHRARKRAERRVASWLRERLAEAGAKRTSVVETAAVDAAAGSTGNQQSARPVGISRDSAASDRCQGNTAVSPYPVPEVKRCA